MSALGTIPVVAALRTSDVVFDLAVAGFVVAFVGEMIVSRVRRRRERRRSLRFARGMCTDCGHSLAGNTSGVCPECGTPAPKHLKPGTPTPAHGLTGGAAQTRRQATRSAEAPTMSPRPGKGSP